jgi:hypothetical protein
MRGDGAPAQIEQDIAQLEAHVEQLSQDRLCYHAQLMNVCSYACFVNVIAVFFSFWTARICSHLASSKIFFLHVHGLWVGSETCGCMAAGCGSGARGFGLL